MRPPNETDLSALKNRGAKMIAFHGRSHGVFAPADTANGMDRLYASRSGKADACARLFPAIAIRRRALLRVPLSTQMRRSRSHPRHPAAIGR